MNLISIDTKLTFSRIYTYIHLYVSHIVYCQDYCGFLFTVNILYKYMLRWKIFRYKYIVEYILIYK